MAPFGPENPKPVFEARKVYVLNSLNNFKDRHIRFVAGQASNDTMFNVVGFDLIEHYEQLSNTEFFSITFTLEENTYNGITSLQLRIKDIKFDNT
jgi:single-stranded-DNA-specific exonuclease